MLFRENGFLNEEKYIIDTGNILGGLSDATGLLNSTLVNNVREFLRKFIKVECWIVSEIKCHRFLGHDLRLNKYKIIKNFVSFS